MHEIGTLIRVVEDGEVLGMPCPGAAVVAPRRTSEEELGQIPNPAARRQHHSPYYCKISAAGGRYIVIRELV
jgi:hypothetical protein